MTINNGENNQIEENMLFDSEEFLSTGKKGRNKGNENLEDINGVSEKVETILEL